MLKSTKIVLFGFSIAMSTVIVQAQQNTEEQQPMSFFVTSIGTGNGANLGGLEGADQHCQTLAEAAGSTGQTWRAYLSTQASDGQPAVNARDRIGNGPWHNAKGVQIGANLDSLHYDNSNINYAGALNENGNTINSGGMGNTPNRHDILTGSQLDGTAFPPTEDMTCSNWTNGDDDGAAFVGHHDRFRRSTPGSSWNSVHKSRGCSLEKLKMSGGDGLFYCFASDS